MVDRRILPNLRWIAERFPIYVTDGYSGPLPNGEHAGCDGCHVKQLRPLQRPRRRHRRRSAASDKCDAKLARRSPASPAGPSRSRTDPRPPFRWVGYDGDAGHGCGHHLHLSWNHAVGAAVPARRMGRSLPGQPSGARQPTTPPARASRRRRRKPPPRPARRHLHGPAPAASPPAATDRTARSSAARCELMRLASVGCGDAPAPPSRSSPCCSPSPAAAGATTRRRSPAWKERAPTCERSPRRPGEVRLSGETPISDCLAENQQGGDLATVGDGDGRGGDRAQRRGARRAGRRRPTCSSAT